MDAYIVFFALVGISMCLLGLNMLATIDHDARSRPDLVAAADLRLGGRLDRDPQAARGAGAVAALAMALMDRTAQTTFFIPSGGGSQYLYENLFWVFGHPEVYILALPGMGIVLEILPVFARKPLWGYRLAVSGLLGVTL